MESILKETDFTHMGLECPEISKLNRYNIQERLAALKRTKLSFRVIIFEGENILFETTINRRNKLNFDDVPKELLHRIPKHTIIDARKKTNKPTSINFYL